MIGSTHSLPHAILPAQAPPPFPEPKIRAARRVQGLVFTPPHSTPSPSSTPPPTTTPPSPTSNSSTTSAAAHATSLERRSSVAGNILLIEGDNGDAGAEFSKTARGSTHATPRAYMLQRKIKSTRFGTIRVGYALQAKSDEGGDSTSSATAWEVALNESGFGGGGEGTLEDATELVAVTIKEKSKVLWDHGGGGGGGGGSHPNTAQDPKSELSAMQMVAALEQLDDDQEGRGGHVVATNWIAADDAHVYIVTPFCKEGSLFDYCMRQKRLPEGDARFFFRQILKALETLQRAELCHRDVNLQNILLSGTTCTLMNLSCALRIPIDPDTGAPRMIEPQPPCASNPQTVAPELLRNDAFDGCAVDLWAAGVALFTMLLGADALFAAPVLEDRTFRRICEGNLRDVIHDVQHARDAAIPDPSSSSASSEPSTGPPALSDGAVDLLQQMLRPEPRSRLTLSQVRSHEWVVGNDAGGEGADATAAANVPFVPTRRFSSFMAED